ncbi:hypothetical protein BJV77DRAFT_958340 [Russula vinacea]|nr:hypothetical protein BJV77DRAFT_958340 [Russula vinacea]
MTFDICPSPSLISEPGPSSYGSLHPQHIEHESLAYTPPVLRNSTAHGANHLLPPASLRRRDLHDRFHELPSDRRQTRSVPNSPAVVQVPADLDAVDAGGCLAPWKRDFRSRVKSKASFSYLALDRVGGGSTPALPNQYPIYSATRSAIEDRTRKANGRSYSDPFPLSCAFDVVSLNASDAFVPITVINPPNLFDGILPREIRLRIFGFLVKIHEEDHARKVDERRWTANKASKQKWVCKAWSTLIYDGQLWSDLDFRAFPKITASQILHVVESAGNHSLKGMPAVTNETCEILSQHCPRLVSLDLSRCKNLTGAGIRSFLTSAVTRAELLPLIELRLSGLKGITDSMMSALGKAAPYLEVLDLSYCRDLHNSSLDAFVACSEDLTLDSISLTARQAGRNPNDDIACSHLAHAMPQLEFLELGRAGGDLKDDGIVRLLETLPNLRKLDLEDAAEITDNHTVSAGAIKEFVKLARERKARDATMVAIDCRSMSESIVKDLADSTRPRLGWRAYEARRLAYLDGRDDEALGIGQDECDPERVVLKTFASWQIVDAVAAAGGVVMPIPPPRVPLPRMDSRSGRGGGLRGGCVHLE